MHDIRDFEERFILSLIHSQRFRMYALNNIHPQWLRDADMRFMYECIQSLVKREKPITFISVSLYLRRDTRISDEKSQELCNVLAPYIEEDRSDLLEGIIQDIQETVEEQVQKTLSERALVKATSLFDNGDYKNIFQLFRQLEIQSIYSVPDISGFWDSVDNIEKITKIEKGIPTGIKGYDENGDIYTLDSFIWGEGIGRGQLLLLAGDSNSGKSTMALNIGIYQSLRGFNVGYFSLEMSKEYLMARTLSVLTQIPTFELDFNKKEAMVRLAQVRERFPQAKDILFFHYPANRLTPGEISKNLDFLEREGRKVDSLTVDYVDLMKEPKGVKERRLAIGQNTIELRAIATEHNVIATSPSQVNRPSMKEKVKKGRDLSEDISKYFTADILLSINVEECKIKDFKGKETTQEIFRIFLAKNRFGRKGVLLRIEPNMGTGQFIDMMEGD
jgi:replicative DNA helicase